METKLVQLVYAGQWDDKQYAYFLLDENGESTQYCGFAKRLKPGNPGMILAVEAIFEDNGSLRSAGTRNFTPKRFSNKKLILEWEAKQQAYKTEKALENLAKVSTLDETLETLQRAYLKLSPTKRTAFLAHVIYKITQ